MRGGKVEKRAETRRQKGTEGEDATRMATRVREGKTKEK